MNGMIINALEEAAQIGMLATQAEIVGAKVLMESPTLPKFVKEGMIYRKLAILETQDMANVSLKLRFKNPREGYELTEQIYSFAEAPVVNQDHLFQLCAAHFTKQDAVENKKAIGVEYGVLNKETAFFGKIKQKGAKSTEEPQFVECQI